jgi:amidophosphoribosyltransferase
MCGFFGIIAKTDVAAEIHVALQALQHRGQDSAGIATMSEDGDSFSIRRGLGPVTQALGRKDIDSLVGPVGIGHVRYPTIGRGVLEDTQPFFYRVPGVLMAHNGNITNYDVLKKSLRERSIHLLSQCDVEPVLCEFADHLMSLKVSKHTMSDAVEALKAVLERVKGAYSLVLALELDGQPTLVILRDTRGIRPCVYGQLPDGSWATASESVALDVLGVHEICEPNPGEAVFLRPNEAPVSYQIEQNQPTPCIFEFIYFARPDAVMTGESVYEIRLRLGHELAQRVQHKQIEADVVFPVPDTARPAATSLAEAMGLNLREGFIKNRYSGRTFIMPDAVTRQDALRLKLNILPREIKNKRILLVDDSIVRGNTLKRVIELLRGAGALAVHLAIHSPPVSNPCFYGIDMSTEEELFARQFEGDLDQVEQEAARALGADTLTYLDVAGMDRSFGHSRCAACFDGNYPIPVSNEDRDSIACDRRSGRY